VDEYQGVWSHRTIVLSLELDQLLVTADAGRIEQVLGNYLSNALKYSPEGTSVSVSLSACSERVRVAVMDQGPGLPPEEQQRIWERFRRVAGMKTLDGSGVGLGLGLYICKTIIELHGGEVGVESCVGDGSTFWFTLPLPQSKASLGD
jgi:signal transduction histidine kinase